MRGHRWTLVVLAIAIFACMGAVAGAQADPLPSWNDGAAKRAIVEFVQATTTRGRPTFVEPADRIATFDQDGTLWVEQPLYTQLVFCLDRTGKRASAATLTQPAMQEIIATCLAGMSVEQFQTAVKQWVDTAKDDRWKRRYTELAYQPMIDLLTYLRSNGYKTYIVTGGGQDFVRAFARGVYGVPPEQVVGTAGAVSFKYDKGGKPYLYKEPKLLLNDDKAGKPEGIHLVIGERPYAAFGNSDGDRQMLEYTKAGTGPRLAMLVIHDDDKREYVYGPAMGLPNSTVGTFSQALYDEAMKSGWVVISMKHDWRRVFSFDAP